jgi:folate-binding protein YgfZ
MSKAFYVTLPHRGLIHIEGEDRKAFLQGLITNDMADLAPGRLLYACLLTPQGKFLHDFFMQEGDGFILLECEGGARAHNLYERLLQYRLRSNVKLSVEEDVKIYGLLDIENNSTSPIIPTSHPLFADPRHPDMGARSFEKPACEERPFAVWDKHRITRGIPDGSRDMEVERSTLLECNLDKFNAIDWDKGCYMGQELTARMHYRGLAKKHLYPVKITGETPAPFADIGSIGNMRSSCEDIGLALLRDDLIKELDNDSYPIRLLGQ